MPTTTINLDELEARTHNGGFAGAPMSVAEMEALIARVRRAEASGLADGIFRRRVEGWLAKSFGEELEHSACPMVLRAAVHEHTAVEAGEDFATIRGEVDAMLEAVQPRADALPVAWLVEAPWFDEPRAETSPRVVQHWQLRGLEGITLTPLYRAVPEPHSLVPSADALELLRELEWSANDDYLVQDDHCPTCSAHKSNGHADGCLLAAVLAGAEATGGEPLPLRIPDTTLALADAGPVSIKRFRAVADQAARRNGVDLAAVREFVRRGVLRAPPVDQVRAALAVLGALLDLVEMARGETSA